MLNLKCLMCQIYFIIFIFLSVSKPSTGYSGRKYSKEDILKLREEVREMFNHAYTGYLKYAYPYDELRPLSCDGVDTWGSYSLTLIDALDTLAVMGNYSEFRRVVDIVTTKANFDANINVSVFETNIRIVGGLLSAHLLSQRAGVDLEPGWPCNGPLLRLAEDVAKRLIAAFDTSTGMPYGTVNLRHGVPEGETSITCTAGVGTFILEFGTLSRLTGDPIYEEVALNALYALYNYRSSIGLYGNHIDVMTGRWTAQDSGIGAGVDSYLEYLVKGALLVQRPELIAIFNEGRVAIDKHLKRNDWYLWVSMHKGQVTLPVFQSLEAYWPGVLSLIGDISGGMKSMHNYHQVWKQYGFTPEFYNIAQGQVGTNRESYPLRPELIESAMYLYRATKDPFLLDVGTDILRSIQHSARTKCGYATIKDCRDHSLENRMESFFLAETTKYLYLLFDPDNFIHNNGQHGTVHTLPSGRECILDAGGYIFNTEAHPLDPGALLCCSENLNEPKRFNRETARGEKFTSFVRQTQVKQTPPLVTQEYSFRIIKSDDQLADLPSAFIDEEPSATQTAEFLKKLEQSGAEEVQAPLPSRDEVKPIGSEPHQRKFSLNQLQIIQDVMGPDIENHLTDMAWSRDMWIKLVETMKKSKKTVNEENFTFIKGSKISKNDKKSNFPSERLEQERTSSNKVDKNKNLFLSSLEPDLFDMAVTHNLESIKDNILLEIDLTLTQFKNFYRHLELTKNVEDISNDPELLSKFFTRRIEVMLSATLIAKSCDEASQLIRAVEDDKDITVELFNRLMGLAMDAKTINDFNEKYNSYLETVNKIIDIEKETYYSERSNYNNSDLEENINNDESDVNESEEVSNSYGNEDSGNYFLTNNWKIDEISYQVDDRERVTPVSKEDAGPLFTDKLKLKSEDVINLLPKSLVSSESLFDPQLLLERIRANPKYYRNATWTSRYELLTCLPQPYFTRIMLSGEFFND